MKVETSAKLRYLRVAPRKVRLLVDLIRSKQVDEALAQLAVSKKDAALPVAKLLKSAIANAVHNDHVDPKTLVIAKAFVDGGPALKRWAPHAFGRATQFKKRTSHVTLILEGEAAEEASKKKTKKEEVVVEAEEAAPETAEKKTAKKKPAAKKKAAAPKEKKKSVAKKSK